MIGNDEELIQHTVSVRYRVYGTGVLRTTLYSLQEQSTSVLPTITMSAQTDRFPNILANFRNQRTQVQFQTTGFDETFTIAKFTVFVKPSASGYPQ